MCLYIDWDIPLYLLDALNITYIGNISIGTTH